MMDRMDTGVNDGSNGYGSEWCLMDTGVNGGYNGYGSEWWIEWIRE